MIFISNNRVSPQTWPRDSKIAFCFFSRFHCTNTASVTFFHVTLLRFWKMLRTKIIDLRPLSLSNRTPHLLQCDNVTIMKLRRRDAAKNRTNLTAFI